MGLSWWGGVQVFLTIARKAEVEAAAQEGRSQQSLHLPGGQLLKVALGEEHATVEGGSQQYQIKWAQDESGNLQVAWPWQSCSAHPMSACPFLNGSSVQCLEWAQSGMFQFMLLSALMATYICIQHKVAPVYR